ncbi:VIN3-like protein 1 [Bienertia sinuspersici]
MQCANHLKKGKFILCFKRVRESSKLPKSGSKREILNCLEEEKETKFSLEGIMIEHQLKVCNKNVKNPDGRKTASTAYNSISKKQSRKGENPTRFLLKTDQSSDLIHSGAWICKNSACRARLTKDDAFCGRCSCCICHQFDDNKDPSLWLTCESESEQGDSCGLSCHIECAFQQEKVGVVNLGQYMNLDGSYCCASCGKVSGILGCWKKQLTTAKDARRVDVLCYRIYLSYRLLYGTAKFKDLHEIVTEAKTKLEAEVGPMNGESVKMARGIVSRLAIAADVQKLCLHAIDKADEWLANVSSNSPDCKVDSLPAACRFLFEEVAASSLVIVLIDIPTPITDSIKGYKLWYCKSREETFPKDPASIFPREKRRISVTHLQPCSEYTFRIISYTESGDLGHSEAKCFTKSVEIVNKNSSPAGCRKEKSSVEGSSSQPDSQLGGLSSGFKVRDLGKILHLAWAQEQGCLEGFCSADIEQCCGVTKHESPKDHQSPPPVSRELDLNVVSVPDLNEDLTPPLESSRDEDNGCTLERIIGPDDDAASHGVDKNGLVLVRSNGSGPSDDSQAWASIRNGDVPAVDSLAETHRKRASSANEETHDCDSTLINGSPFRVSSGPGSLDCNFEYCVKVIRWLECEGYIKQEFRLKLLTWFSLRSTEQERRVVNTFIQTLMDDPKSLAGQLVDSFGDLISCKRPRSSFTTCGGTALTDLLDWSMKNHPPEATLPPPPPPSPPSLAARASLPGTGYTPADPDPTTQPPLPLNHLSPTLKPPLLHSKILPSLHRHRGGGLGTRRWGGEGVLGWGKGGSGEGRLGGRVWVSRGIAGAG